MRITDESCDAALINTAYMFTSQLKLFSNSTRFSSWMSSDTGRELYIWLYLAWTSQLITENLHSVCLEQRQRRTRITDESCDAAQINTAYMFTSRSKLFSNSTRFSSWMSSDTGRELYIWLFGLNKSVYHWKSSFSTYVWNNANDARVSLTNLVTQLWYKYCVYVYLSIKTFFSNSTQFSSWMSSDTREENYIYD
jgi:hypothetical protein